MRDHKAIQIANLRECKYQLLLDLIYLSEGDNMFRHVFQLHLQFPGGIERLNQEG